MSKKEIRVGVVGLGFMGRAHTANYEKIEGARVVAVADADPDRRQGKANVQGNIEVPLPKLGVENYQVFADGRDLIREADLDLVDICLPTYLHSEFATLAAEAGRHVMVEKPMALNSDEAAQMIEAAHRNGVELMVGQCLRFWPEYVHLKETLDSGRLGRLVKAEFIRRDSKPVWTWDGWMTDAKRSGGATWDLHVHDVDFINYLLGKPSRISARAIKTPATGGYDMVSALYTYDNGPEVLVDAAWYQTSTFSFRASYLAMFEEGMLHFDSTRSPALHEHQVGHDMKEIPLEGDAYYRELEFLVNCLREGRSPATVVSPESTRQSLQLVEAEWRSSETGEPVTP